jgi:hypothetical protein
MAFNEETGYSSGREMPLDGMDYGWFEFEKLADELGLEYQEDWQFEWDTWKRAWVKSCAASNIRITELERERDEARAEARVWKNRTRCLFTKYCSRTFDCPTESYLERTIVKLDEEIAAVDKET